MMQFITRHLYQDPLILCMRNMYLTGAYLLPAIQGDIFPEIVILQNSLLEHIFPGCLQDIEFQCNASVCIDMVRRCDTKKDCEDGKDEEDCGLYLSLCLYLPLKYCGTYMIIILAVNIKHCGTKCTCLILAVHIKYCGRYIYTKVYC